MTCTHGLDEMNCPICRIIRSTLPKNFLETNQNLFSKIKNPLFRKNYQKDQEILKSLFPKKVNLNSYPINLISQPNLINQIPNFKNKLLSERLNELELSKLDKFGINKKIPLENPDWKFEKD